MSIFKLGKRNFDDFEREQDSTWHTSRNKRGLVEENESEYMEQKMKNSVERGLNKPDQKWESRDLTSLITKRVSVTNTYSQGVKEIKKIRVRDENRKNLPYKEESDHCQLRTYKQADLALYFNRRHIHITTIMELGRKVITHTMIEGEVEDVALLSQNAFCSMFGILSQGRLSFITLSKNFTVMSKSFKFSLPKIDPSWSL